jgi:tyrosine-protein kinase Etk/Wzc
MTQSDSPKSISGSHDVMATTVPAGITSVAAGPASSAQVTLSSGRIAWVQSFIILARHKKLIAAITFVVTAATAIIAFSEPNVYTSTTVVLPPRKASSGMLENLTSGLSSTIRDLGITRLGGASEGGAYTPLSLVNSRELQDKLIAEFDLVKRYDAENLETARRELQELLNARTTEYASFAISFTDTDPKLAATVANRAAQLMNETSTRLAQEEARTNRTQIELRYMKCLADLDSAEAALGIFQRKYGVYSMPEQAKAQATAIATLEQQKYTFELQQSLASQLYGTNSPDAQAYKTSASEIDSKLGELRYAPEGNSSFLALNALPDVALNYLRTMREVEIQSKLKAFLLPAFEQAKLDENKQSLAFLVLDKAVPPARKSGPRRSIMLLIAMAGSVILSSLLILYYYRFQHAKARFGADKALLGLK